MAKDELSLKQEGLKPDSKQPPGFKVCSIGLVEQHLCQLEGAVLMTRPCKGRPQCARSDKAVYMADLCLADFVLAAASLSVWH